MAERITIPFKNVVEEILSENVRKVVIEGGRKKDRERLEKTLSNIQFSYKRRISNPEKYRQTYYVLFLKHITLA